MTPVEQVDFFFLRRDYERLYEIASMYGLDNELYYYFIIFNFNGQTLSTIVYGLVYGPL